jgi:4'-phosphopantetheinyl transferase
MDVFWLEQSAADVPEHDDWLGANEARVLNGMRFAKRRADWRLGRWTAKRGLAAYLNVPGDAHALSAIEITSEPSGAPQAIFANKPAAVTISLSHRAGRAICAIAPSGAVLGCDLEMIEPRSDAFATDYFTAEEQALVARAPAADRYRLLALLWSAKESALKALRVGLRLDTRCVIVSLACELSREGDDGWHPLEARYEDRTFHGWWHNQGNFLRTVVGTPAPVEPIPL